MLFTSSIFSFFTCLNMASYSVSKRGLEAFADCLRVEMSSFGVKVSTDSHSTSLLSAPSQCDVPLLNCDSLAGKHNPAWELW